MRSIILGVIASIAAAGSVSAMGWDVKNGQSEIKGHPQLQYATSDAQALKLCGPKPPTPGKWRCAGHQSNGGARGGTEQTKVGETYRQIEWTWTDGGKTSSDDWESRY